MYAAVPALETTAPINLWSETDVPTPIGGLYNTIRPVPYRVVPFRTKTNPHTVSTTAVIDLEETLHSPTDWRYAHVPTEPDQYQILSLELLSYIDLPEGWDGYHAVPASLDAVVDAFTFLSARPSDILLPFPQLSSDGEVGLYWRTHEVYAEAGFYGDGLFSYYAIYTSPETAPEEHGDDDCPLIADMEIKEWPEGFLLTLGKIHS